MVKRIYISILVFFLCVSVGFTQDYAIEDIDVDNISAKKQVLEEEQDADKIKANFLPLNKNNQTENLIFTATILTLICSTLLLLIMNQRKGKRIGGLEEQVKMLSSKYATSTLLLSKYLSTTKAVVTNQRLFTGLPKGDIFQRNAVSDSFVAGSSRFLLELIEGNKEEALFSIVADIAAQVKMINDELPLIEDACEFTNLPINAATMTVIEKGKVRQIGKVWKVTQKAKVSFAS